MSSDFIHTQGNCLPSIRTRTTGSSQTTGNFNQLACSHPLISVVENLSPTLCVKSNCCLAKEDQTIPSCSFSFCYQSVVNICNLMNHPILKTGYYSVES